MVRVSTVTTLSTINSTSFGNALITDYLSQTDTNAQAIASDVTGAAAKILAFPTLKCDTLAEKTGAAGIAVSHDINYAAGKRPKADLFYFNPAAAPAATEGHLYYDSTAHLLKLRTNSAWVDVPNVAAGGAYHLPPKVTVYKDGSNYHVIDADGATLYNSTSFEVAMNDEAFAGLSAGRGVAEKVLVVGDMTVDDRILLPSLLDLEIQGRWTAVNGLDDDMVANDAPATNNYNVYIHGNAILDGNSANQASGRGIYLRNNTDPPSLFSDPTCYFPTYLIEGLSIYNTYGNNLHINFENSPTSQYGLRDVKVYQQGTAGSSGLYLWNTCDSWIEGGLYQCNNVASYAMFGTSTYYTKIHPDYISNGKVQFEGGYRNDITVGCVSDCSYDVDNFRLLGENYSRIHDITFHRFGNGTANTYDGVHLGNAWGSRDSTHNTFSNLIAHHYLTGGSQTLKYCVEEADANQNYNIYHSINGVDCATGAVRMLGANSKPAVTHEGDFIMGTVVRV